ncbi:MAG: glycosyl hydrolase 53 family protein [Bacteroidales bacterium]
MKTRTLFHLFLLIFFLPAFIPSCKKGKSEIVGVKDIDTPVFYNSEKFCMGADLSYVNQILDHGGIYKDSGNIVNPYKIFKTHGANVIRLRLWHYPAWTKEVYGVAGTQMYNDIKDVEKAISIIKENGMEVNLDFHFSDTWADPGKQIVPEAWKNIKDTTVLKDSVYNYTFNVLKYLDSKGLMPDMVQIGNEINCGLFITENEVGFPNLNCCNGKWRELGAILNSGIKAVRDVSSLSAIKAKIILHVADPKNVEWWFDNIISQANVTDFDIVGFSYYPLWHTTLGYGQIENKIALFKSKYNKKVMIMEFAYPWTYEDADTYSNAFGNQSPVGSFPFSKDGQFNLLKDLTQKIINAGGDGIFYWEPAWISSDMKDLWGTGSSWDNAALFDFDGNVLKSIDFMTYKYTFPSK